jgi:hypothetical protein
MKAIPLTRGFAAVVDDEDYDRLCKQKWCALVSRDGRAMAYRVQWMKGEKRYRSVYMHREITSAQKGQYVDHINFDTLDNRRSNLRPCSPLESVRHQRGRRKRRFEHKGITAFRNGKYRARIQVNGKPIELGTFPNQKMAAEAYQKAAEKYFGEFGELWPGKPATVDGKTYKLESSA